MSKINSRIARRRTDLQSQDTFNRNNKNIHAILAHPHMLLFYWLSKMNRLIRLIMFGWIERDGYSPDFYKNPIFPFLMTFSFAGNWENKV